MFSFLFSFKGELFHRPEKQVEKQNRATDVNRLNSIHNKGPLSFFYAATKQQSKQTQLNTTAFKLHLCVGVFLKKQHKSNTRPLNTQTKITWYNYVPSIVELYFSPSHMPSVGCFGIGCWDLACPGSH